MKKGKKHGEKTLDEALAAGKWQGLCEKYLLCELSEENEKGGFPNVAGFCRFYAIGKKEYERFRRKYPDSFDRLEAVLEDEAFHARLPAAVLSPYLRHYFFGDGEKSAGDGEKAQGDEFLAAKEELSGDGG